VKVTKEELTKCLVNGKQFHLRCDCATDGAPYEPVLWMDVIPFKANIDNLKASEVLYRMCSPIGETKWIIGSLEEACLCGARAYEAWSLTMADINSSNQDD
jgi:hypothetical protein